MELKQSTSFSMTKDSIKAGRIQGTACCPVSANENDLIYLCHVDYASECSSLLCSAFIFDSYETVQVSEWIQ